MGINWKREAVTNPDTSVPDGSFLMGFDSVDAVKPSPYPIASVAEKIAALYPTADTTNAIAIAATIQASLDAMAAEGDLVYLPLFGAVPERAVGETNDNAAFDRAIVAAGVGGKITLNPSVTYTVTASIDLLDWQTLDGNGATIKRANQVTATTTTAMTSGVTNSVTVNDASGFKIGDQVALSQVGTARSALALGVTLTNIRTITGKVGNVITLNNVVDCNLSIGSKIFSAFPVVKHADRTTVKNVTFDGNRTNNAWARWETHTELWEPTGVEEPVTSRCNITNAPGEGIVMQGSCGTVAKCTFTTLGGNGTHFSAATNPRVLYCDFVDGNLDTAVGHVSGALGWSRSVTDVIAIGCTVDGFARGFGEISDSDDGAKILFCKFANCYGHGGMISASAKRILVEGCTIENCATDTSKVPSAASYGGILLANVYSRDIKVINNDIDGPLYVVGTTGTYDGETSTNTRVILDDNRVTGETLITGLVNGSIRKLKTLAKMRVGSLTDTDIEDCCSDLTGSTDYCLAVYTGTVTRVAIRNFRSIGGLRSISVDSGVTMAGLSVEGGRLYNASGRGIVVDSTSAGFSASGVEIRRGTSDVSNGYIAILNASPGSSITHCKIWNDGSGAGEEGLYPKSTATGSWWAFNEVHGSWSVAVYFGDVTTAFSNSNAYHGSLTTGSGNTHSNNVSI